MAPKQEQESALLNPLVEDHQDSDEDSESFHYVPPRRRHCTGCRCFGWLFSLLSIIFISAISGAWIAMAYLNIDQTCAIHTTKWSPVLKDVPITYQEQPFDGNFMEENSFRKNGSHEVDKAWESLGVDYRPGVISYEDGIASGLTDAHVQVSPEHGGGFIVNVEGMHHLHCLNLLRKSLYFNYDHYKKMGGHAFKNDGEVFRLHVTHCLDTIRQVLMCNVDTGVLGQVWYDKKDPNAFPDFNTKHTCKNYDDIRKFAKKLQAPPPDTLPKNFLANPVPEHVQEYTP
ncbi:tat pathway signal sequence [Fusarium austroafricanum]|uniref:Tat pathway signal sequence n=1 Tax=Fusarium austroafricanum TaxID=2364996 RepID=A0A8H4KS32_9HYPO|nr:tat pathway signal sequence [Fusarium austroafricanum]